MPGPIINQQLRLGLSGHSTIQ